jgi:hypothetical protein
MPIIGVSGKEGSRESFSLLKTFFTVDEHMEAAWEVLLQLGQFHVFELFDGDTLIAADYVHALRGGSFYVATRYHNKSCTLSPGFLLAFLEARYLQQRGATIWDLGQTDGNPIMAYKAVTTVVVARSTHYQRMRMTDGNSNKIVISNGVCVDVVTDECLFGYTQSCAMSAGKQQKKGQQKKK